MSLRDLMRPDLLALEEMPEMPSRQELESRLGRRLAKLDANENPYGPSPRVREALRHIAPEWYPDAECTALRRSLGEYLAVDPDRIVCSAGGDEMLDLLLRLFLKPGDEVINCPPSFVMYPLSTVYNHGRLLEVPRDACFGVDPAAVESALTPRTKVIFLCNPNNPTGNRTPEETIHRLLATGRVVVLDEAYAEFAGWSHVDWSERYPNLVVLRTMSKWAALAGVRLGYAVVHPDVRRAMRQIKSPFNVNAAAQAAGIASLADRAYLMTNVARLIAERERLRAGLEALPFGRVHPSHTNFLYWETGGMPAARWHDALLQRAILVRPFSGPTEALRISVGLPEDTDAVLAALREVHPTLVA